MRKLPVVLGIVVAVLLLQGGLQSAGAEPITQCLVKVCLTEHGEDVKGCFNPTTFDETQGGSAGKPGGEVCEVFKSVLPCSEIPECAARETPALGTVALVLTALGLGAGGTIVRRRRTRR